MSAPIAATCAAVLALIAWWLRQRHLSRIAAVAAVALVVWSAAAAVNLPASGSPDEIRKDADRARRQLDRDVKTRSDEAVKRMREIAREQGQRRR